MNMHEAVIAAAAVSRSQVRGSYLRAVAGGVQNTHCSPAEERGYGALKLLALATLRLPDLVLYVHLMHVYHDDGHEHEDESDRGAADVVTRAVGDIAAGGLRLADRALERHGCELGYQTSAWVDRALEHAAGELADGLADGEEREIPVGLEQVRRATIALTRAIAATASDPMRVPEEVANGVGHLLAVYLIATEVARQ
jgi:hypothetical protein